jgi:hypothetical protein
MGYDTLSANDMPPGDPREDSKLLMIARDEDRILLTRDGELARRDQIQALFLNGERLEDQIRQLICASLIIPELRLTRCSVCNNPLIPITEDDFGRLKRKIPDFGTTQEPVLWCRQCTRAYWEGSHTSNMRNRITEISKNDTVLNVTEVERSDDEA